MRGAVLHITDAEGGGTDRYLRDIAATTPGPHWIWHAGAGLDVIEEVAEKRFGTPAGTLALEQFMRRVGVVHLHGVTAPCIERLDRALRARQVPYIVSLHDLTVVAPDAFTAGAMPAPDADWIRSTHGRLQDAAAVIAPSQFIRDIVATHYRGIPVRVIAPGIGPMPMPPTLEAPAEFTAGAPRHVVAVVGALGPHKGSALLPEIASQLATCDAGLVVIGYTDTQITRGWVVPGNLYVHGPYEDTTPAGLLAAYAADCVLFPNRLPESFSYTLSEAWQAGLPVIVPDEGALGERVARDGGGWRLPPGFGAPEVAALLSRLLAPAAPAEWAQVKSQIVPGDAARVPTLVAMAEEFDLLYAQIAVPAAADAGNDALTPLLAANLDGFVFRRELVKLATELGEAKRALAETKPWVVKLQDELAETRTWMQKLERDVASLQTELDHTIAENRRLADIRDAFDVLPAVLRKALLKWTFRGRG